jgi:hypothetical protein
MDWSNLITGIFGALGGFGLREIIARKYQTSAERAERQRALLIELNGRIELLPNNYMLFLTTQVMKQQAKTEPERQAYEKTWQELGAKQAELVQWLGRHELEFPREIRERIRSLRRAMEIPDVSRLFDPTIVLPQTDRVTTEVKSLKAELDRIVK